MTAKQNSLYWRQWAAVRKVLIDLGGYSTADADAERHRIADEALGKHVSSTKFTNADLDKVLDAFRAYLVLPDGPATGPTREAAQPRNRLIWAIQNTGLGDEYIGTISLDQFKRTDWRALTEKQLAALRWTCISRARAMRRRTTENEQLKPLPKKSRAAGETAQAGAVHCPESDLIPGGSGSLPAGEATDRFQDT